MATALNSLQHYFTAFSMFGVSFCKNLEFRNSSIGQKIGRIMIGILESFVVIFSIVELAGFIFFYEQKNHNDSIKFVAIAAILPTVNFLLLFVWKFWINKKQQIIFSALKKLPANDTIKSSAKIRFFVLISISLIVKMVDVITILIFIGKNDNLELLNLTIAGIISTGKNLLPILSCCFLISLCDLISWRLEEICLEISSAKSHYRAAKVLETSIEKYQKLEILSREINHCFSCILLSSCVVGTFAFTICFTYILNGDDRISTVLLFFYDGSACFILSLAAMYSAKRANSKVNKHSNTILIATIT